MRVAILGAGSIGLGMAALLAQAGHAPILWSPSGERTRVFRDGAVLRASGAVAGDFTVEVAQSCEDALAGASVVVLAVPGNGHDIVMQACAPHLRAGQTMIISSHCSLSGLYLAKLLADRGVVIPIVALGTTVVTGRQTEAGSVRVAAVRRQIDLAALPATETGAAMALCSSLFGDRFKARSDLLAISLSNLNPQNHLGMALCNFTRIELGESWGNYAGITPSVGRLIEALDDERLAVAGAFGAEVRTVREHFHLSFDVPLGPVSDMAAAIHARGNAPLGPTDVNTRYVYEDVPFGLVTTEYLARLAGVPSPLHSAGIALFSGLYGIAFRTENTILPQLGLEHMTVDLFREICRSGWLTQ